jgi:hypothetical protein
MGVSTYLTITSVLEGNEGTRRMKEEGAFDLIDVKGRRGGTKGMLTKSSAHIGGKVFQSGKKQSQYIRHRCTSSRASDPNRLLVYIRHRCKVQVKVREVK